MVNDTIPMSKVRTISGISDETWNQAKTEYDNISGKINELLKEDLETEKANNEEHVDLLKNSDLTTKQKKTARHLIKKGDIKKTPQQLGNVLRTYFAEKEYRDKCRKDLIKSDAVPFEKKGKGIQAIDTPCEDCDIEIPLQFLRNNEFECPQCDKRLYDVGDE